MQVTLSDLVIGCEKKGFLGQWRVPSGSRWNCTLLYALFAQQAKIIFTTGSEIILHLGCVCVCVCERERERERERMKHVYV